MTQGRNSTRKSVILAQKQISLEEQGRTAFQLFTHFQALNVLPLLPEHKRCKVRSIQVYGSTQRVHGISLRPSFPGQADVCQVLKTYIPGSGGNFDTLPKLTFTKQFDIWPEDVQVLLTPWQKLENLSKRAIRDVKMSRQQSKVSPRTG